MDKQTEYLNVLQERNRLKKKMTAKTKEDLMNEERERGFTTYLQGANKEKDASKKKSSSVFSDRSPVGRDALADIIPTSNPKKGWSEPPKMILGRNVMEIHIEKQSTCEGPVQSASNGRDSCCTPDPDLSMDEYGYDDDFEEVSNESLSSRSRSPPFADEESCDNLIALPTASLHTSEMYNEELHNPFQPPKTNIDALVGRAIMAATSSPHKLSLPSPTVDDKKYSGANCGKTTNPASEFSQRLLALEPWAQSLVVGMIGKLEQDGIKKENVNEIKQILSSGRFSSKSLIRRVDEDILQPADEQRLLVSTPPPSIDRRTIRQNAMDFSSPVETIENSSNSYSSRRNNEAIDENQARLGTIHIRVRIHSLWAKAKQAAVQALGLFFSLPGLAPMHEIGFTSLEVTVKSGLELLPKSSQAVRSLREQLFNAKSLSSIRQVEAWKCPMPNTGVLELHINYQLQQALLEKFPTEDAALGSLYLFIWNSELNGPPLASPLRDIDVFVGSACVFSGELRPGAGQLDAVSLKAVKLNVAPSVVVGLHQTTVDPPSMIRTLFPPAQQCAAAVSNSAISDDRVAETSTKLSDSAVEKEASGPPSWLLELKAEGKTDDKAGDIPVQMTPKLVSELTFDGPHRQADMAARTPDGRAARRRRTEAAAGASNPHDMPRRPMAGLGGEGRSGDYRTTTERKADDANLRQSLEAIRRSDRQNRGRLGVSVAREGSLDSVPERQEHQLSELKLGPGEPLHVSQFDSKFRRRSQRIDEIQEKVQSTLASLATAGVLTPGVSPLATAAAMQDGKPTRGFGGRTGEAGEMSPRKSADDFSPTMRPSSSTSSSAASIAALGSTATLGSLSPTISGHHSPTRAARADFLTRPSLPSFASPPQSPASALEASYVPLSEGLPRGTLLRLDILSTWGDEFYVGLNGIDVFDEQGSLLWMGHGIKSVAADPPDINVLPEYGNDPRVVSNLVNGNNFTRDDMYVWLAPLGCTTEATIASGAIATVSLHLTKETSITMLRIFNYNKSRTHSFRGARHVRISADSKLIFNGEIKRAPGLLSSADTASEVILFSKTDTVIQSIAKHDEMAGYFADDTTREWVSKLKSTTVEQRPSTADAHGSPTSKADRLPMRQAGVSQLLVARPTTGAPNSYLPPSAGPRISAQGRFSEPAVASILEPLKRDDVTAAISSSSGSKSSSSNSRYGTKSNDKYVNSSSSSSRSSSRFDYGLSETDLVVCRKVAIRIDTTWGDDNYTGLAGLQVLKERQCNPVDIDTSQLTTNPKDLSVLGFFDDKRVPDNLINNYNDTANDKMMWLCPFTPGGSHVVEVQFNSATALSGFRIWNYNKASVDDLLRGARLISILIDGREFGSWELRMGPGCDGVPFAQVVLLRDVLRPHPARCPAIGFARSVQHNSLAQAQQLRQDYEVPLLPVASQWKFVLYENWNDPYYVGLDALEFVDEQGKVIDVLAAGATVTACPHSLRDIQAEEADDPRTPEKLFHDRLHSANASQSWLSPLSRCMADDERQRCAIRTITSDGTRPLPVDDGYRNVYPADNTLFVLFDYPVRVAAIRIFNYSKNTSRGVREFAIVADSMIVYMGSLLQADKEKSIPDRDPTQLRRQGQSIVFSKDPTLVRLEREKISYCGTAEQDVLCINERQVIVRSKAMFEPPNVAMEGIRSDIDKRPSTALTS